MQEYSTEPEFDAKDKLLLKKRKTWMKWFFPLVALVLVGIALLGLWARSNDRPVSGPHTVETLKIGEGMSTWQVATLLEDNHLVRSRLLFWMYMEWKHQAKFIQPGTYHIKRGTGIEELAYIIEQPPVAAKIVTVNIPEGFTVTQIATRLQLDGVCSKSAFLKAEEHDAFSEPFLSQVTETKDTKYRLEGYLFPATYQFYKGESAHLVLDDFLQAFQTEYNHSIAIGLKQRGITLTQLLTEASLIEREAKVEKERPLIASVIVNRLRHDPPMRLQIDATLEYILGYQSVVTDKDTQVNDPYNTYLIDGLPPGPIGNPGLASIQAALHPAKTDYLFYVVKNDKTGEHFFASTYAEQLQNERISQQNLIKNSH